MKNELSQTFSSFHELKINCHPYVGGKQNRRYTQNFMRLRNCNGSEIREALKDQKKESPLTTQLKTRCRRILYDKRLHNQRKLANAARQSGSELDLEVKLLTDTSVPENSEPVSRVNSRQSSLAKRYEHSSSEYFTAKFDDSPLLFRDISKRKSQLRRSKKRLESGSQTGEKPTEVLTITKINTDDNIQRYYGRLLEICLEKERQLDRKIINCKQSPSRRTQLRRPYQRVKTVQFSPQKQLMLKSAGSFFNKPPIAQDQELDESAIQFLVSDAHCQIHEHGKMDSIDFRTGIFAKAYSIIHFTSGSYNLLFEHNSEAKLEIASLTKIMTCLLVLLIGERFRLDLRTVEISISQKASKLQGTSAKLQYGDSLKIFDLLFGLMLPSGNDAALALAEWGGKIIRLSCGRARQQRQTSSPRLNHKPQRKPPEQKRSHVGLFVLHMNALARQLNMMRTRFANPHGLMNKRNYSCTSDLVRLCIHCMSRQDFREIVGRRNHSCTILNRKYVGQRTQTWHNTNRLLHNDSFIGIKTGITPSAGPCLASCFAVAPSEWVFVVLLNTITVAHRFDESKKLLAVALKKLHARTGSMLYISHLQRLSEETPREEDAEDSNNFEPSEDSEDAYEEDS